MVTLYVLEQISFLFQSLCVAGFTQPSREQFILTHVKEEADASFSVFELADVEHHGEELIGAADHKKNLLEQSC